MTIVGSWGHPDLDDRLSSRDALFVNGDKSGVSTELMTYQEYNLGLAVSRDRSALVDVSVNGHMHNGNLSGGQRRTSDRKEVRPAIPRELLALPQRVDRD